MLNSKHILFPVLFVFFLFFQTGLCIAQYNTMFRLPNAPSLPSGDEGEVGGIIYPEYANQPVEERYSTGLPQDFQENEIRKNRQKEYEIMESNEIRKANKNKINYQPMDTRIDTQIRTDVSEIGNGSVRIDKSKESLSEEQVSAPRREKSPSWIYPSNPLCSLLLNVPGSPLYVYVPGSPFTTPAYCFINNDNNSKNDNKSK